MKSSLPRIIPPLFMLIGLLCMIGLHYYLPIGYWLLFPWRYAGIVLILAGVMLGAGSGMLFRRLGTNPRPGAKATLVVRTGPFRYSRNPMYLGLITILTGTALLLGSISPLIIIPVIALILHYQFVLREEKLMEGWFGDEYLRYKNEVRRWV